MKSLLVKAPSRTNLPMVPRPIIPKPKRAVASFFIVFLVKLSILSTVFTSPIYRTLLTEHYEPFAS